MRTLKDSKVMLGSTQEEENKTMDLQTQAKVEKLVREIYSLCKVEGADAKMGNASTLQLLNEIEKKVDSFEQGFKLYETVDLEVMERQQKEIKMERRQAKRLETQKEEQRINEEKQNKRLEERERKNFLKQGRTIMARSYKP